MNLELTNPGAMGLIDSDVLAVANTLIPGDWQKLCKRIRYFRFSNFGNYSFPLICYKFKYLYNTLTLSH